MRYGGGVLLAVAFVVLALALVRDERAGARAIVGAALFGGGVMWFGWTSFDMHVLERYDWPDGSSVVLGDLLYHGSGLVVATAGWLLLAPTFAPTRRS
jgi:drug/metabolite transporter (DMT)-like permease